MIEHPWTMVISLGLGTYSATKNYVLKHEISDAVKYFAHQQLKVSQYIYIDVCRAWGIKPT